MKRLIRHISKDGKYGLAVQIIPVIIGVVILNLSFSSTGKNPHGKNFTRKCSECHGTTGWTMSANSSFDHITTAFKLDGRHNAVNCRDCHPSLIFEEAQPNCYSCHTDVHEQTLGQDCDRCHTPDAWLVTGINQIHQNSRFPLVGAHLTADCYDCHKTESLLKFEPLGVNCIDCHKEAYLATEEPNHKDAGFSFNCEDCHLFNALEWSASGINHNFFPLEQGHKINDCTKCHDIGDYGSASPDCFSCHKDDYNEADNPNHVLSKFSEICTDCHDMHPDWKPATFDHDPVFPIYSGKHNSEWNKCTDCHNSGGDYSQFTCIDCHEHNKAKMDGEHDEEPDYRYNSIDCLDCHPKGEGDD